MTEAAERVGSAEHAAIFREAAALWPGGQIPSDYERYAATQYKRATALGSVLGRYIRANTDEFVAG